MTGSIPLFESVTLKRLASIITIDVGRVETIHGGHPDRKVGIGHQRL